MRSDVSLSYWAAAWLCATAAAVGATLVEDLTAPLPPKLVDTGLLDGRGQPSHAAVMTYEPAWPLWSNGSDKRRHVFIPPGRQIDTSDPNDWKYPVGTIFFKTFSFATRDGSRPVETRVIRGTASGWEFAVYEWNAEGSEAVLADIASAKPLELTAPDGKPIRHEIPSRLHCRQCHEANGNFILGFSELNLNHPLAPQAAEPGRTHLEAFHDRGLFTHLPERPAVIEEDELQSREIRGYVQGNCVHCHNGRSQVDLRHDVFLANTLSRPTNGFMFPPGTRIQPGRPEESLLYLALSRTHPLASTHMPPIGVQEPDAAAIQRVAAWITSLEGRPLPDPPPHDLRSRMATPVQARTAPARPLQAIAATGFVPNRHASSLINTHRYPLGFEPVALDGDHAMTRGFTAIRFLPGSDQFLLAEHEGRVSLYRFTPSGAHHQGEFRLPDVCVNIECGLVTMELDPDFDANGFLYVGYCHQDPSQVKVARLRFDPADPARTPETLAPVIAVDAPGGKPWHTIGAIVFDAHKRLWILTGERGLGAPAGQLDSLLGAALCIIPNRNPGESGYRIPDDNPRARWYMRGRDELFAKGLRNPWTATFDPLGRLWIGDVGERFEEINLLDPRRGYHDFGWPRHDGRCDYGCRGAVNPVIAYTRSGDHPYFQEDPGTFPVAQQCVYVGPYCLPVEADPYEGILDHTLLFGDLSLGWVRGLTLDAAGRITRDRLLAKLPGITSWSRGPDGHFYVTTFAAYTQDVAGVFKLVKTR